MTNSYKKEYPLAGFPGFGGGAGALYYKSAGVTKYVDEVFSTNVWIGNESARTISTGVDNNKGALAWVKSRNDTHDHHLVDTVRGANELLYSNSSAIQANTANRITGFTNDGYTIGSAGQVNGTSSYNYAGWNFRKKEGFFDIVTYTGTGSAQNISHELGCVPGMILIKCTTNGYDWAVYHRQLGNTKTVWLNYDQQEATSSTYWNDTSPTSTQFTVGSSNHTNLNGATFIAYLFADGGTTATAVDFNASNNGQKVEIASNSDFAWGTGNYTIECYIKLVSGNTMSHPLLFEGRPASSNGTYTTFYFNGNNQLALYTNGAHVFDPSADTAIPYDQWNHVALVRSGTGTNETKLYINGTLAESGTDANNYGSQRCAFGPGSHSWGAGGAYMGQVTSYRVTKGQAIYTSNFTPTYEPLTLISQGATASNVKLLCANSNDPYASIKTPSTITGGTTLLSTVQAVLRSDSTSSIFGVDEDKDIIKCGSYDGTGVAYSGSVGLEVSLGWEPQWILLKNISNDSREWIIFDNMRGWVTGGDDERLKPNSTASEGGNNALDITPTGFRLVSTASNWNENASTIIYCAIRRPDAVAGKPASAGTSVFAMDVGNASSTIPTFDSGFPVDFAMMRTPSAADPNFIGARLTGTSGNKFNASPPEASSDFGSQWAWDSNAGWCANSNYSTSTNSWMWKRGQGFDVVAYTGNGVDGRYIPHSLNAVPKMMMVKTRTDGSIGWAVYHVGLNGGVNPEQYYLQMPGNDNAVDSDNRWKDTAPTSTHFVVGDSSRVNLNGSDYLALLFGDVTGISKCGYYTGDGTSDGSHSIDVGFQPRFIIIKQNNGTNWKNYVVIDTLRGEDNIMYLNADTAQSSSDLLDISSTGWSFKSSDELVNSNENSNRYVYYAHA